jgi:capping protein beta
MQFLKAENDLPLDDSTAHVGNIGRIVEDMESKMRNALHEIYFGKTKDIANDLRSVHSLNEVRKQSLIQAELFGKLQDRNR